MVDNELQEEGFVGAAHSARRSMVRLIPMTVEEFEEYLERDIERYAKENVKAGYWAPAEALEKSRKEHQQLLPTGLATPDHHFLKILDEGGMAIGAAWLKANRDTPVPSGFVYDLFLEEARRGQGYGKQAMLALEEKAKELGLRTLALHVFAHNAEARALYEGLGYQVKSLNMEKLLT
jgi:GNAT superfamily N-acetyltransferase